MCFSREVGRLSILTKQSSHPGCHMTRPIAPLLLLIATFVLLNACDSQPPASNEAPRTTDPAVKSAGPAARGTGDACDEEIASPPVRSHLNRIEDAATPEPFACFGLHAPVSAQGNQAKLGLPAPGSTQGNQAKLGIELAEESDGIDPATERVLVSLDGELLALPTGSFEPKGRNQWVYRADGPRGSGPILRIEIRGPDPKGGIELTLHVWRPPQLGGHLLVRIGDDWGAVDLDTGERVGGGSELDTGTAASASVGPEGGTVSSGGWTLTVPPGALETTTEITLTPFADGTGVSLKPHGLTFDRPATLEGGEGTLALRTSPLSTLPLYEGTGATVLWHFSDVEETSSDDATTDFAAWADAALADLGEMTFSEAQELLALVAYQDFTACEHDCMDRNEIVEAMTEAVAVLAESSCQDDVDDPTDAAVIRWLDLASAVDRLGGDGQPGRDCALDIFGALVAEAREAAVADPSDANLRRLVDLLREARRFLGFPEGPIIDAFDAALRSLLEDAVALCEADQTDAGSAELERGIERIADLGTPFTGSRLEADFEDALEDCECPGAYEIAVAPPSFFPTIADLNRHGAVPGRLSGEAVLWDGATAESIHDPSFDPSRTDGRAVNDHGEVVGKLSLGTTIERPSSQRLFHWSAGTGMVEIELRANDHIEDGFLSTRAINNNGDALAVWFVGSDELAEELGFDRLGYVWNSDGTSHQLQRLADFEDVLERVVPLDINDAGQIVGSVSADPTQGRIQHAVLWESPTAAPTDLGVLEGERLSFSLAINDAGEVVGFSGLHGFLWTEGTGMVSLTPPGFHRSRALDINDDSDVVGFACETSDSSSCFQYLWRDESGDRRIQVSEMTDLNDLIDAGSGWSIRHQPQIGINNEGMILVRRADHDDPGRRRRSLLLTPSGDGATACTTSN